MLGDFLLDVEDKLRLPDEGKLAENFLLEDVEDNLRLPDEGELDEELPSDAGEVEGELD